MNIKDRILRLFGYENIENIYIKEEFKKHLPRYEKMHDRRLYYHWKKKFFVPIVVDSLTNLLEDGYTSYLIAKENNIKYVKVVRV